jgi:hypothetical protein
MSDEFDGLDAMEKAGVGTTLNRCRALASKIGNELRNKRPEHFVDKLSLASVHASLERAADVLSTVKGSQARGASGRQAAGARLGVVAIRLDLYNRARNDAANTYERPAREVGGGIEFKHLCAAKNARGAPSVKRRDHLLLFAFAWVVHNEEGCHRSRAQRPRKLEAALCLVLKPWE